MSEIIGLIVLCAALIALVALVGRDFGKDE